MVAGDDSWEKKAVYIHGCPSTWQEIKNKLCGFMWMQVQVFAIDLPGYGKSTGKK